MTTTASPAVWTIADWCRHIGISPRHFHNLVARGQGPAMVSLGRRKLIRAEAGEAWLRERESVG